MEESAFWEANSSSASQEIPRNFIESEGLLPYSKSKPPVPVLSQIDLVYAPISLYDDGHRMRPKYVGVINKQRV
jgi:hypothetical protein